VLKQWSASLIFGVLPYESGVLSLTDDELTFFPVPAGLQGVRRWRLEQVKQVTAEAGWVFWHIAIQSDSGVCELRVSGNVDAIVRQIQAAVIARTRIIYGERPT
jgi:hypothetical protein